MEPAVARAIERWDALLAECGPDEQAEQLRVGLVGRGLVIGERPLCSVLRPHIVSQADLQRQAQLAELVISAIHKVRAALDDDEQLREAHLGGFVEWIGDLLSLEARPVGQGTLLRLDASLARTQLHFIELNADMPHGSGHNDGILDAFEALEVCQRFIGEAGARPLRLQPGVRDALLGTWREWGGQDEPTVAIVTVGDDPVRATNMQLDRDFLERHGVTALVADARELSFDGRRLHCGDTPVDLVERVILTGECIRRRDELSGLMKAAQAGAVCLVNPFLSELLGHKALFALLSDPAYDFGFTAAEHAAIRAHVPWTRAVFDGRTTDPSGGDVELLPYAADHRERLVLKPTHDFGGHGVRLGWHESDADWSSLLAASVGGDYILQHRVELHRERYPTMAGDAETFYEDTDPFLFRGALGGYLTRLSASEITNVHAHGSVVPTLVIGAG
jgi:hypothetical protein